MKKFGTPVGAGPGSENEKLPGLVDVEALVLVLVVLLALLLFDELFVIVTVLVVLVDVELLGVIEPLLVDPPRPGCEPDLRLPDEVC
jgi:hypothetical protein